MQIGVLSFASLKSGIIVSLPYMCILYAHINKAKSLNTENVYLIFLLSILELIMYFSNFLYLGPCDTMKKVSNQSDFGNVTSVLVIAYISCTLVT